MDFIIFVLSKFRTKLLAANHLIISKRTKFGAEQKSSKFLLQIMALASSANNIGFDTEFILRGMSFIYIMNNGQALDLILWELHVLIYPKQGNSFEVYYVISLQLSVFF